MPLPDEILAESSALFHDTRAQDIDPEAHAAFVIERVLDRGTLRSVGALLRYYGRDRIRSFLREGGTERVSKRTVPLWAAFLQIAPDECIPRSHDLLAHKRKRDAAAEEAFGSFGGRSAGAGHLRRVTSVGLQSGQESSD
jgi:hypothetical protein